MTSNEVATRVFTHEKNKLLAWYEERLQAAAMLVPQLLKKLRDEKGEPWKPEFATFEEYCRLRLGYEPRRVQQIIEAQTIRELLAESCPEMTPIVEKMKEEPVRILGKVPVDKRKEVLEMAAAGAIKGVVTGRQLKQAKAKVLSTTIGTNSSAAVKPAPCLCPHCHRPMRRAA